ncbi:unnamed protein product [Pleuronectes platessa]|uniref:Uncharacterized protein n=1 Tax=Pleuronectes platessa TaxID=8262 RepID=A0A9N7YIX4_PLEPL|nr:unnamed protein product [Pleuronectes platessa]
MSCCRRGNGGHGTAKGRGNIQSKKQGEKREWREGEEAAAEGRVLEGKELWGEERGERWSCKKEKERAGRLNGNIREEEGSKDAKSTFPVEGLLVTLMAWEEDHVTSSPRCEANMAVAFVSPAPSLPPDSLELTN